MRIQFETGQTVEFQGTPTEADIEEIAASLRVGPKGALGSKVSGAGNTPLDRSQQTAFYKSEAERTAKEAKKASNPFRIGTETLKGVGEVIAASEVGLADSLRKIFGNQGGKITEANRQLADSNLKLLQRMRENKATGKDNSRLAKVFNENQDVLGLNQLTLDEEQLPTTQQVVGQIGGTALDILTAGTFKPGMQTGKLAQGTKLAGLGAGTGLPELTKLGSQQAGGLFTKQGLKNIGKGAGIGYTADVTSGLQGFRGEDRQGGKAFIPGLGTAIGAGIPTISEGVQSIKNRRDPSKIVENRLNDLQKIQDSNAPVRRIIEAAEKRGVRVKEKLAQTDLLNGTVDNTGTIRTNDAIAKVDEFLDPQEGVVLQNLEKEGKKLPLSYIRAKLKNTINKGGLEGSALTTGNNSVDREIEGYLQRADKDGYITLADLQRAKISKTSTINYLNPESRKVDKTIARGLKELIEDNTDSVDVRELNKELANYYEIRSLLKKLDGKKVRDGRLGTWFAKLIGAMAGSHFGPLGTIIGAEVAGKVKGVGLAGTFGGKMGGKLEQSGAMKQAIQSGKPASAIELPETFIGQGKRELKEVAKALSDEGGFVRLGKVPRLNVDDSGTLQDFLDFVTGKYNPEGNEAIDLEIAARRLVEKYGGNPEMGNKPLASQINRIFNLR